jgi:hypothetical protein
LALRSLGLSPGCRDCGALTGPGDGAQINPYEPTAPETGPLAREERYCFLLTYGRWVSRLLRRPLSVGRRAKC